MFEDQIQIESHSFWDEDRTVISVTVALLLVKYINVATQIIKLLLIRIVKLGSD